ncbi:unnamed protein product [Parajaminaea phylloscopi]
MLSLFRGPNRQTLRLREAHLAERDRALCIALEDGTDDKSTGVTPATRLQDLPSEEIEVQEGDIEILSSDLTTLVDGVRTRRWTSTRMLHAFIRATRRAQLACNPVTVANFGAALERSRELDAEFQRTGELVGPLHGVPFSIKEQYHVKGLTTTVGYTAWIDDGEARDDAALARIVHHLGGVIIAKTNIPQTMLSFECRNPLYGRTNNPWSAGHTCGGSSGGEAALLASDGSAAGWGSDIGGSLRIPTGYCGIYALKPTKGRLPSKGTKSARGGFEAIPVAVAQMCRSAADVELLTRLVIPLLHPSPEDEAKTGLDPRAAQERFHTEPLRPCPLRPAWFSPIQVSRARGKPLRIGHYSCDGIVKTSPACLRGMRESVAALERAYGRDVELVAIDPPALRSVEAMRIFLHCVGADGFDGLLAPLSAGKVREPMDLSLFLPVFASRASPWMRKVFYWLLRYVVRDHRLSYVLNGGGRKTAGQHFEAVAQRDDFEADFIAGVWQRYDLDAILCPLQASPAVSHGATAKLSGMAASTTLFNVMDNAVCIVPVTRVDAQLDALPGIDGSHRAPPANDTQARSKWDEWNATAGFDTCSRLITRSLYDEGVYDSKAMAGLPVSVQIVTRKFEEEKAIGIMRLLDDALRQREDDAGRGGWGPGAFSRSQLAQGS